MNSGEVQNHGHECANMCECKCAWIQLLQHFTHPPTNRHDIQGFYLLAVNNEIVKGFNTYAEACEYNNTIDDISCIIWCAAYNFFLMPKKIKFMMSNCDACKNIF